MRSQKQSNFSGVGLGATLFSLSSLCLAVGLGVASAGPILWSEGFETYNTDPGQNYGGLDKNKSGSPNAAPNGSGNPWFGPSPNNAWVTKEMTNPLPIQETVTPHSGLFMIRGSRSTDWFSAWDNDLDHVNLAYRFNGGAAFKNNFAIDWWFYDILGNTFPGDPDKGPGCFGDYARIEYLATAPTNTDYVSNGALGSPTAGLAIGAYEGDLGYIPSVYQVQVVAAPDGQFGDGWFNTTMTRSRGWHHAAIVVDGNNVATFSIDNTNVLTHATGATTGFNVFTTFELQTTPDTYNQSAYYDDISLRVLPQILGARQSGADLLISATNQAAATCCLLTSTNPGLPLSQWTAVSTNVLSAGGGFTFVVTNALNTVPQSFFVIQAR